MIFSVKNYILLLFVFNFSSVTYGQSHSRIFNPETAPEQKTQKLKVTDVNTFQKRAFNLQPGWDILSQSTAEVDLSSSTQNKIGHFKVENDKAVSNETYFVKSNPIVLLNQRTKNIGVLTGTLEIKLKSNETNINQIVNDYNLALLHSFPHLDTYFVSSKNETFNLEAIFQSLSNDERILSVNLEIIDRSYDKK